MNIERQNKGLGLLLTPSWLLNFVAISFSVLLTAGVIVLDLYQRSDLRQQIFEAGYSIESSSWGSVALNVGKYIARNHFLSNLPLLITWACVGLIVYFFAASIASSFSHMVDVRDEMGYVHVSRNQVLREAFSHLLVRAAATLCLFLFTKLSLSLFIPYALAAAHIATESSSLSTIGFALLSVVVLYFVIYIATIFLRLIVLRPRIFTR